ncbi:MAG: sugar phosphate isomerase/epimerase [Lentisphaeria bacterium]|nr:sugar phosphate isomerase/epimerase [Lentisphaeria bacterium]
MRLSVSSNLFSSAGDPEDALRLISETGFTHIMWGHHWNSDFAYGRYELSAIAGMLRRYHLTLQDVHGCANAEKSWFSVLEYQRKAGIELIVNRLRMMKRLGATGVLVMHQPRIKADSSPGEIAYKRRQFDSLRRSMDEITPILEKMDARIALENMPGDTWEFLKYLLDNYPADRFGFCFDSGHANIDLRKQFAECEAYRSRIWAVHLHDNDGTGDQHQAPFYGTVDWQRVARMLDSSGYEGVINFELHIQKTGFFSPEHPAAAQPPENVRAYLTDTYARCEKFGAMCRRGV